MAVFHTACSPELIRVCKKIPSVYIRENLRMVENANTLIFKESGYRFTVAQFSSEKRPFLSSLVVGIKPLRLQGFFREMRMEK